MAILPLPIGFIIKALGLTVSLDVFPKRAIGSILPQITVFEEPDDELEITQNPVEQGASVSDHAFKRPSTIRAQYGWTNASAAAKGNPQYVQKFYDALLKLQQDIQPFTLVTGRRKYPNTLIKSLRIKTDQATATSLLVDAQFQQLLIVRTQFANGLNAANMSNPASNAPTQPTGSQNLQAAPGFNQQAFAAAGGQ